MEAYTLPAHPDAVAENQFLQETCDIIGEEIVRMEQETGVGAEEERVVVVPEGLDSDEQVAMNLFRLKVDTLHQLARSRHQAYFAHLDFVPEGGQPETHYIGRWGVVKMPEMDIRVVDWRSPIANLYYSGQIGPMDYEAPDGRVKGELTLKRMLTVHDRRLEGIFDSGVVSQDAYLQGVLGAVTSDRLREIVTTIQAEQNQVIRFPFRENLIVQGVAGSGKTTIALHRIAYLLYAQRETLRPEQMMILAPNPLFLSYISQVLPDLGVERVRQTTFADLCMGWMGKNAPKLQLSEGMEDKLTATPQAREALGQVLRRKGSPDMKARLERWLDGLQETILPPEGLSFGGAVLMSAGELREVFLQQLRPWPLVKRIDELKKVVARRMNRACETMKERLQQMAQSRLEQLLATMPDGEERRARVRKLLASREERLAEVDQRAKEYLKGFRALFPPLDLVSVYRDYLCAQEDAQLQAATLPLLEKKRIRGEDLAAVCTICRALYGLPRETARHIVMDECQDFSPWQLLLLREVMPGAAFTLVGDLMQGIHEDEGIRGYDEWLEPVFGGKVTVRTLVTSYRSTMEIMEAANTVAARHPVPGQTLAQPVLRHGARPTVRTFTTDAQRIAALTAQVEAWLREGYHTVALIEKTEAAAKKLLRALPASLNARLLRQDDANYAGGVLVLPAAMVKGLEFDCVALCNVNNAQFPEGDVFLARMLYVMMTRPLHALAAFATGEVSRLLEGMARVSG